MHTKNTWKCAISPDILIVACLLIVNLLMLLSLTLELIAIERFCSYAIIILSFGMYLYSIVRRPKLDNSDLLLFFIFIYVILLITFKNLSFEGIVSVVVFLSMLTIWRSAREISCTDQMKTMIHVFYIVQGIFLIVLCFTPLAYKGFTDYEVVSDLLTLGFANPNQTGIVLFSTIAILIITSTKKMGIIKKVFIIGECVALSIMVFLTGARTSILGLLFLLIIILWKKGIRRNVLIPDLIICFPIAFVYGYLWLAETKLGDVTFLGKNLLSGRQEVFTNVLYMFQDKLFGNLEYFNFQNSHNALLTILVNIGIVGLGLYLIFTIASFNSLYRKIESRNQMICCAAILALFVMGCAETAVLTGGTIYFTSMFFIVQLANADRQE